MRVDAARYGWPDIAYLLRRRWARMLVVGGLVFAAGALGVLWRPPCFTAAMRLVVVPAGGPDDGRAARNQAELLRDPGLVGAQVAALDALARQVPPDWRVRLGLRTPPAEGEALARQVSAALRVAAMGDTDVVTLALRWPDRRFAAAALELVVRSYRQQAAAATAARARLVAAQGELETAQVRLAAAGVPGPADELAAPEGARQREEARGQAAREQADAARLERALAQRRLDGLEASFKAGGWVDVGDGDEHAAGAPVAGGFAALLERRQVLLAAGKADSAALRALDREVARVRQQNFDAARQALVGRMASLDDRLGVLTATMADAEDRLRALDRRSAAAAARAEALRAAARDVAGARLAVARAQGEAESGWHAAGVAQVVSDARATADEDGPGLGVLLGAVAAVAGVAALSSAAWAEARRVTLDRPADILRKLDLEVLAQLGDARPVGLR